MSKHLCFVYGTLLSDDVVRALNVCAIRVGRATLACYTRNCIEGERFPGIVWTGNAVDSVQGLLLELKGDQDLAVFDWFENVASEMYTRELVTVKLHSEDHGEEKEVQCGAYVVGKTLKEYILEGTEWDFDIFCKEHLSGYLEDIKR